VAFAADEPFPGPSPGPEETGAGTNTMNHPDHNNYGDPLLPNPGWHHPRKVKQTDKTSPGSTQLGEKTRN
jgi:hypothetical protein